MENKNTTDDYKYLVYFEGKPIHFNIKSKRIIIYKDVYDFKDKECNTKEIKNYIKEWAYNK